jgi:hypothetical protein
VQDFAGHERRVLQVEHRIDDVGDFTNASYRVQLRQRLVLRWLVHRRLDDAESDCVGTNSTRGVFDGQLAGGRIQAALGQRGKRRRHIRIGVFDERRRNRDQMTTVTLVEHPGHRRAGHLEEATQIYARNGVVVLVRVVDEWLGDEDACVVDHGVDPPEALDRGVDDALADTWLCKVSRHAQHHRIVTGVDSAGIGHDGIAELAVSGDKGLADSL